MHCAIKLPAGGSIKAQGFQPLPRVGLELGANLIAHTTEGGELFRIGALSLGGVIEGPVVFLGLAGEDRAGGIGIPAHGNDSVHFALEKFIKMLGGVRADIESGLFHHGHRHGVDMTGGLGTGAGNLESTTHGGAEKALGEVTAAAVAGAED
jgi:hypothetical protein